MNSVGIFLQEKLDAGENPDVIIMQESITNNMTQIGKQPLNIKVYGIDVIISLWTAWTVDVTSHLLPCRVVHTTSVVYYNYNYIISNIEVKLI